MDSKANKNSGEAGKTAIQVVERMMNLLDCLADHEESSSLKLLSQQTGLHPLLPTASSMIWSRAGSLSVAMVVPIN